MLAVAALGLAGLAAFALVATPAPPKGTPCDITHPILAAGVTLSPQYYAAQADAWRRSGCAGTPPPP